jgi:hypothetical protein
VRGSRCNSSDLLGKSRKRCSNCNSEGPQNLTKLSFGARRSGLMLPLAFDASSQRHPLERERSLSPKWCAVAFLGKWRAWAPRAV